MYSFDSSVINNCQLILEVWLKISCTDTHTHTQTNTNNSNDSHNDKGNTCKACNVSIQKLQLNLRS